MVIAILKISLPLLPPRCPQSGYMLYVSDLCRRFRLITYTICQVGVLRSNIFTQEISPLWM